MTAKRAAVLRVLSEGGHLTAEEVFARVREQFPGVVLATVYNNLHALCEAGLARRVRTDEGADYFDKTPTRHDHAVCAACRKMFDLPGGDLTEWLSEAAGVPVLSYNLSVSVLCPDCREKN